MDNKRDRIISDIDMIIGALSAPLSADEAASGWREEIKQKYKAFFEDIRARLKAGESFPHMSISRSLDMWGVISGELLDKAAQISNDIRSLSATSQQ